MFMLVLFSVGFSFFSFSAHKRRIALTDETLEAQARYIGSLQAKLDALSKEIAFLRASDDKSVQPRQANSKVDTPPFNQKLLFLENEVAAIRKLLDGEIYSRNISRYSVSNSNDQKKTQEEYSWYDEEDQKHFNAGGTPESAAAEKERLDQELRILDELVAREDPDPDWSGGMIEEIEDILNQVPISGDSQIIVSDNDCKSSLCRVEIVTPGFEQSHIIEQALLENVSDETPQIITTRQNQENGNVVSTFYLIKDEEALR